MYLKEKQVAFKNLKAFDPFFLLNLIPATKAIIAVVGVMNCGRDKVGTLNCFYNCHGR